MTTPIRPSLSQLLGTPQTLATQTPATPRTQATDNATRNPQTTTLAAQRDFFRQVTGAAPQNITPATFKAADITRATTPAIPQPTAGNGNSEQAMLRPGSYINIRV